MTSPSEASSIPAADVRAETGIGQPGGMYQSAGVKAASAST
jgi:hypothetical protein